MGSRIVRYPRGGSAAIQKSIHTRFRELQANDVLDLERGVYRAIKIALYSSYQLPAPPPMRALAKQPTTHDPAAKQPGQITAIDPDIR
jgi:hypothetical protein